MDLKRIVTWVLGALAIGTAARAVVRPEPSAPQPSAPPPSAPQPGEEPATAVLPFGLDGDSAVGKLVQSDSVKEARSYLSALTTRIKDHATPLLAGALAYYGFLAIFPAAIATVAIYALVQDPAGLEAQVQDISEALPADAASIITKQLEDLVGTAGGGVTVSAGLSIVGALWAASAGMKALMKGIDDAYDVTETRNFLVLRGMAVLLTFGAILFLITAISSVTFLPELLGNIGLEEEATRAVEWLRWPGLFIAVILALGVLYKLAPNRPAGMQRLFSWGAVVAALLWLLATVGFSLYTSLIGSENVNQTYGALGGVIVLLLWFYLSGFIVLLGAEFNAELELRRRAARSAQ
jgi:membrane protein